MACRGPACETACHGFCIEWCIPMEPNAITDLLGSPGLVSRIGNTPLVPIGGLDGVRAGVEVRGKAEWLNPGGSVKDRAAWAMVEAGEASGALAPGRTLIDATSGNTGIAYAWIGAARGFAVELCVPANAGLARKRLLAALGARIFLTDPMSGTEGAMLEARRRVAADTRRYFYPDQYSNPANWKAHKRGRGSRSAGRRAPRSWQLSGSRASSRAAWSCASCPTAPSVTSATRCGRRAREPEAHGGRCRPRAARRARRPPRRAFVSLVLS